MTSRRRAFVTGALGFIGGAIGERLRSEGWQVTGVDLRDAGGPGVIARDICEAGEWQQAASKTPSPRVVEQCHP